MILLYQIKRDKRDKFRSPKKFFRIFKNFFQKPLDKCTQTVAEALKSLRKRTRLSQTAFGDICGGIPLRTIQNWESGVRECPDYVLFLIKSHLKSENLI